MLQTEAAIRCFHFTCGLPPGTSAFVAADTAQPSASLPLPSPYGSLLRRQRGEQIFSRRNWASWVEGGCRGEGEKKERKGESDDSPGRATSGELRVASESSFDVEALLSRLPTVGVGARMRDYAVNLSQLDEALLPPDQSSASSPCPFIASVGVLQELGDGRSSVHFALLYFDAVTC